MGNFYGQFDTDKIATSFFDFAGNAIEVGAAQGVAASNTLHFEQNGWQVLCIEPNPKLFAVLQKRRPHTMNVALGAKNEDDVEFTVITLANGDQSALSGLKVDEALVKIHPIASRETITVQVRTLDTVLKDFGKFDALHYLSIDTEGTELDVLKGFTIENWNPRLIIVENNHDTNEVRDYLKEKGYDFVRRSGVNDFFVYNNAVQPVGESTENSSNDTSPRDMDSSSRRTKATSSRRKS